MRTVTNLWRQEQQACNVLYIAKRDWELYDKLVGFLVDFEKIDGRLKQAQHSYDDAFRKLTVGNGNVIQQAQILKDMSIKPSKSLPPTMIESALEEHSEGDIAPHW